MVWEGEVSRGPAAGNKWERCEPDVTVGSESPGTRGHQEHSNDKKVHEAKRKGLGKSVGVCVCVADRVSFSLKNDMMVEKEG